jgi:outer membrane protein
MDLAKDGAVDLGGADYGLVRGVLGSAAMSTPLAFAALVVSMTALDVGTALAQDNSSAAGGPLRTMPLADAVAYARTHQPEIRAALARVEQQHLVSKIPGSQWYPLLDATGQLFAMTPNNTTGTYVDPGYMDVPRIGGTAFTTGFSDATFQPYPSTFVGLGVTQELWDFGRIAAQSAAEDALVDVAKQRARIDLLNVTFDVEEAFYAVSASKNILKAADAAVKRSTVHRDLANAGVASGLRPPIELTRADANLKRYELGQLQASSNLVTAQIVYAAAVGVTDAGLDTPEGSMVVPEEPPLGTALEQAAARDPRILQAVAQLKADEERTKAVGAELRPNLWISGTVSGRAGGAPPSQAGESASGGGWVPNVPNWDAGLVFSWPFYDGTVVARKDASKAEEDVRREELALVRFNQTAAIRRAYVAVDLARQAIPKLQAELDAATKNYEQADARFKAGLGTAVELADAENVLTAADIQRAIGDFTLARARAALGRAIAEGF